MTQKRNMTYAVCSEYRRMARASQGSENKRLNAIENKLDTLTNLINNLGNIEERIIEKVNQIVDQKVKDSMKAISEEKLETKIRVQVEEFLDEQNEIEKKKNNIIIYNLDETDEDDLEADLKNVKEIIEKTSPELTNEFQNIKKDCILRLGRKNTAADKSSKPRPRPLRVKLPDEDFKLHILKNSNKIKKCPNFPNVYIKKDMTRKQHQADYELRKEKYERKTAGEDVIIYNDKVILRTEHPNFKIFNTDKSHFTSTQA